MKTVVVDECAYKACKALEYSGSDLLFAIIEEAMTGTKREFEGTVGSRAVYEAIAPRIKNSLKQAE